MSFKCYQDKPNLIANSCHLNFPLCNFYGGTDDRRLIIKMNNYRRLTSEIRPKKRKNINKQVFMNEVKKKQRRRERR